MATKLHEVIAVEKDVRGTATKIIDETNNTLTKKHQLFSTHAKLYSPLKEGDLEKPEEELAQPITTIGDKMAYFEKHIIRLLDVILQKEEANTRSKQDLVVYNNDVKIVLAEGVPVSVLVQMENIFEQLRTKVYDTIPTLDPTKNWKSDTQAGVGRHITDAVTRQRTAKIVKPLILHPGTDKHPPQVDKISEDVPVGNWSITYYSGLVTPAEKSQMLSRLDMVLEGVKKARARANDIEVNNLHIGKRIFAFLNDGK